MLTVEELMDFLSTIDPKKGVMIRHLPEGGNVPHVARASKVEEYDKGPSYLLLHKQAGHDVPGLVIICAVPDERPHHVDKDGNVLY